MGYRSDVRIVTSTEGFKKLQEFVENYLKKEKVDIGEYNLLNSLDIDSKGKEQCYFGWNYIKWYDFCGFPEIDAIVKGLDYLEKRGFSYRFMEIGEDYRDIEEKCFDGDKDDIDLEYPSLIREFDDEYITNYIEEPLKKDIENNKEGIDI